MNKDWKKEYEELNATYGYCLAKLTKLSGINENLRIRIAELEKENDGLKGQLEDTIGYIEGVDSIIAYWKQKGKTPQTNAEPVAWRRIEENGWYVYYETRCWDDLIPLYTTPQTNPSEEATRLLQEKDLEIHGQKCLIKHLQSVIDVHEQTKPLSTDDLLEPAYKHLFRAEHSNDEIDISYWFTPEELVEYARAIEERILGK